MIDELTSLDGLAERLARRARDAGARLIWRAQTRRASSVVVRDGKPEGMTLGSLSGHGVQIFGSDGRTVLGSRDDFRERPALGLLDDLVDVARSGAGLGIETADVAEMAVTRGRRVPVDPALFAEIDLDGVSRRLLELERGLRERFEALRFSMSFRAEMDAWRIARDDGSDVLFAVPRCMLSVRATGSEDGSRNAVSASLFRPTPAMLHDTESVGVFLQRAERAAELASRLPTAEPHPAGSFPLVIDYALAKGLAHEAFGHASEADGFRSSVLCEDGRFASGREVGPRHLSIIDEPIADDHAWQPYSANGVPRERAVLVDHGRLADALSDPWSATAGGVRPTGAARAESFRDAPQPRMTNIRIEADDPLPAPGRFEDYGPAEVRDLLRASGVLDRHAEIVFLSGYGGGQVNTSTGDFVFQCKAIYRLSKDSIRLFRPAIFSGSMFGALQSIREVFGPLMLDAIGYCGKWGQSVPSSGGSHYFLVVEPHPEVRLGGR